MVDDETLHHTRDVVERTALVHSYALMQSIVDFDYHELASRTCLYIRYGACLLYNDALTWV
jgi:hypothetical protein